MTNITFLHVSAVVAGSELLADEIGRGVTPSRFTDVVAEAVDKRMEELRDIPHIEDVAFSTLLRRKQIVYARLSAIMTTFYAMRGRR